MNAETCFKKAFARREDLLADTTTTAFRLFHGAPEGLAGITIDVYGSYVLVQTHVPGARETISDIFTALRRAALLLPMPIEGFLWKRRTASSPEEQSAAGWRSVLLEGRMPATPLRVLQNGVVAEVDLTAGQHTGLFLDMRTVRQRLRAYYGDCTTMLNLFCYTGMFSVHALRHGITSALNIDLSKSTLAWAQKNYSHNNLSCDSRDFMQGDALLWMHAFEKKARQFSYVVFDPPTFARKKKGVFSIKKDFQKSVARLGRLASGGLVLTVINSPAISQQQYRAFHPGEWRLEFIAHESDDFPCRGTPYLKAGLWRAG
jgi:23S rRNA (cytosine1962-C5)-methyltransferase